MIGHHRSRWVRATMLGACPSGGGGAGSRVGGELRRSPPPCARSPRRSPRPERRRTVAAAAPSPSSLRLHGLVEAVDFYSVMVPRVTGSGRRPEPPDHRPAGGEGTLVRKGDLLVEFDRQLQLRAALDKRAEWLDLEEQIHKKRAEQASQRAQDETASNRQRTPWRWPSSRSIKNPMLPRIEAEKNTLTLEAAEAKFAQLKVSVALKQKAAAADLEILEVRRDRAAEREAARRAQRREDGRPLADRRARRAEVDLEGRADGRAAGGRGAVAREPPSSTSSGRARCGCGSSQPGGSRRLRVGAAGQGDARRLPRARAIRRGCGRSRRLASPASSRQKVRTFVALFDIEGVGSAARPGSVGRRGRGM